MTSSSRSEPPGWITAVAPARATTSSPSRNGKNASDAHTVPVVSSPISRARITASRAGRGPLRHGLEVGGLEVGEIRGLDQEPAEDAAVLGQPRGQRPVAGDLEHPAFLLGALDLLECVRSE